VTNYRKMKRKGQPRTIRRHAAETQRQFVRGVLFLIGVTLLIIFVFGDHGLFQLYKLKRERAKIQEHITELRENREKLIAERNKLENDLVHIEKLAREKYKMAKPGEQVFKVVPNKESNQKPN